MVMGLMSMCPRAPGVINHPIPSPGDFVKFKLFSHTEYIRASFDFERVLKDGMHRDFGPGIPSRHDFLGFSHAFVSNQSDVCLVSTSLKITRKVENTGQYGTAGPHVGLPVETH